MFCYYFSQLELTFLVLPSVIVMFSLHYFVTTASLTRSIHSEAHTGVSTVPTSCGASSLKESSVQVVHKRTYFYLYFLTLSGMLVIDSSQKKIILLHCTEHDSRLGKQAYSYSRWMLTHLWCIIARQRLKFLPETASVNISLGDIYVSMFRFPF